MTDALSQFRAAIHGAGLHPPEVIEPDGKLHRFASNGKGSDDAGWYVLHTDGIPAGAFGDWRGGWSELWRADIGRKLSLQEEAAYRARVDAMRREREAKDTKRRAEAREQAAAIWQAARPAPDDHVYLLKKGINAHGLRVHDGALVIPMRDGAELHSLQFIAPDGDKRFLTGGRVSGCYFPIGKPNGALRIVEGYATGASIHEATGGAAAVSFNAVNLLPVARALRGKFPDLRLIVCADDDAKTPGNPGLTKAREAAQAVGALLAVPDFGANRPDSATDFNDLYRSCGPEAVVRCIEAARRVEAAPDPGEPPRMGEGPPIDAYVQWPEVQRGPSFKDPKRHANASNLIDAPTLWAMNHGPVKWAVVQLLPEGVLLLAGKPKVKKSWLMLSVALAVATGGMALGKLPTVQGDVLYLALKDNKRRLTKRLRLLTKDPPPKTLEFATEWPRVADGGIEQLESWLKAHPNTRLIVVDTLARIRPHAKRADTAYTADYEAVKGFIDLCKSYSVSVVIVCHTRKMESDDPIDLISGTLGLTGGVDGYMVLTKVPMADEAVLYINGRDIDNEMEYPLKWDQAVVSWVITGSVAAALRLSPEKRRVYELLKERPRSTREVAEQIAGVPIEDLRNNSTYRSVSRSLRALKETGLITNAVRFDHRWKVVTTHAASVRQRDGGDVSDVSDVSEGSECSLNRTGLDQPSDTSDTESLGGCPTAGSAKAKRDAGSRAGVAPSDTSDTYTPEPPPGGGVEVEV